MLNFVAMIETELGLRIETITRPDRDSAVELAHRLGNRFGDGGVVSVVVSTLEDFQDELGLIYDNLPDLPA